MNGLHTRAFQMGEGRPPVCLGVQLASSLLCPFRVPAAVLFLAKVYAEGALQWD